MPQELSTSAQRIQTLLSSLELREQSDLILIRITEGEIIAVVA